MTAAESASISPASHRLSRRCRPVFASNRPGNRRFGPCRASEGLDPGLLEVHQPLQVVAARDHRHRKGRSRLADRANRLAPHLLDGREHVLDTDTALGDTVIAPLLAFGQRFVTGAFALDLITVTLVLEPVFTPLGPVAPVRMDSPARVERVEHVLEVLAVRGCWRSRSCG